MSSRFQSFLDRVKRKKHTDMPEQSASQAALPEQIPEQPIAQAAAQDAKEPPLQMDKIKEQHKVPRLKIKEGLSAADEAPNIDRQARKMTVQQSIILDLLKDTLADSNMSVEQRAKALLESTTPEGVMKNIVRILYEQNVSPQQRQENLFNAFYTLQEMIKQDELQQFTGLDQAASALDKEYQVLLRMIEVELGSPVKQACSEFVSDGLKQAQEIVAAKEQEKQAQQEASKDAVVMQIVDGTFNKGTVSNEIRALFLLQEKDPVKIFQSINGRLNSNEPKQQKLGFLIKAIDTLDAMIRLDTAEPKKLAGLSVNGAPLNQAYTQILDSVENKFGKDYRDSVAQIVDKSLSESQEMEKKAKTLQEPPEPNGATINIEDVFKGKLSTQEMYRIADMAADDFLHVNQRLLATANADVRKFDGRVGKETSTMIKLSDSYNNLCQLLAQQILSASTQKEMAKVLEFYVMVAQKSCEKGDYATAFAIQNAWTQRPIDRLGLDRQLSSKLFAAKRNLDEFLTPLGNFKAVRSAARENGGIVPTSLPSKDIEFAGQNPAYIGENQTQYNPEAQLQIAQAIFPMMAQRTAILNSDLEDVMRQRTNIAQRLMDVKPMTEDEFYKLSEQHVPRKGQQSAPAHLDVRKEEPIIDVADPREKAHSAPAKMQQASSSGDVGPSSLNQSSSASMENISDVSPLPKQPNQAQKTEVPPLDLSDISRGSDFERRGVPLPPLDLSKLQSDSPPLSPPVMPQIVQQQNAVAPSSAKQEKEPEVKVESKSEAQAALKETGVKALIKLYEKKTADIKETSAQSKQNKIDDSEPSNKQKTKLK